MNHIKITTHILEKTCRPSLAAAMILTIGTFATAQQAVALDINPNTTAYFGEAESSSEKHTDDCDVAPNICGSSYNTERAGVHAFSIGSTTQRARQTRVLIKPFSVPESDLGAPPENTVLDARVTGNVKWRGTLWTLDLSKLGTVTIPALGPTADAYIRVSLVDVTDPSLPFEVGNDGIADFHCDPIDRELGGEMPVPLASDGVDLELKVGWCEEHSEDTFSFGAKVIQGHDYELQLSMICQAITGAVPTLLSACSFDDTPINYDLKAELEDAFSQHTDGLSIKIPDIPIAMPDAEFELVIPPEEIIGIGRGDLIDDKVEIIIPDTKIPGFDINISQAFIDGVTSSITAFVDAMIPSIDDGYLEWDYMTVTINPDIVGLLGSTKNEILGEVGLVRDDIETVRRGVARNMKLLHTPQGNRMTDRLYGYPDLCGDGDCTWPEKGQ